MRKPKVVQVFSLMVSLMALLAAASYGQAQGEWHSLFDGTSLEGWKASENKDTFSVKDGMIVVDGPRSHLFYAGPLHGADFKNFEWKADVLTKPGANSGMYFHTRYQEVGWPDRGYEVQVNNTHRDSKKTGGLYGVEDVFEAPAKDDEWFTQHVIVQGKRIVVKVNGKVTVDYTEPDDLDRPERQLSRGTVALQGHDPKSVVYYKNILIKPLAD